MASAAQISANRANAKKSTGPKSDKGKSRSSLNAIKHGEHIKHHVILPGEPEEEYEALLDSLNAEFQPRTAFERQLVREMAESQWRLARYGRYEQRALTEAGPNPDVDLLLKYDRLTNSANRAIDKAFNTLKGLRKIRQAHPLFLVPNEKIEETNPIRQIDFEAQNLACPPPPPEEPPDDGTPAKIPYEIGMELQQLKRFHPNFNPRTSRSHLSPELRKFLKKKKNLDLVLGALVFL